MLCGAYVWLECSGCGGTCHGDAFQVFEMLWHLAPKLFNSTRQWDSATPTPARPAAVWARRAPGVLPAVAAMVPRRWPFAALRRERVRDRQARPTRPTQPGRVGRVVGRRFVASCPSL